MTGILAGTVPFVPNSLFAQSGGVPDLIARNSLFQLAPEGYPQTEIWGYNGVNPGPEIRLAQGEAFKTRLLNELSEPTSVHWHGLRIENAMDGVSGLTQDAVAPGEGFDYAFVAPDAGTY